MKFVHWEGGVTHIADDEETTACGRDILGRKVTGKAPKTGRCKECQRAADIAVILKRHWLRPEYVTKPTEPEETDPRDTGLNRMALIQERVAIRARARALESGGKG